MLNNKVVVVTGGAGLLGKAFCEAIIINGGKVVIADINEQEGGIFESELSLKYGENKAYFHQIDITSKESILGFIENVKSRFGKIDAIVNNAYPRNKNYGNHFFDVEYADFCDNVNLNLGGYFLMCKEFARYFKEVGGGNIINIASIYGVIPPRFEIYEETEMTTPVEYAVIKSGLIHLTKYLAKYLKGENIRVNCISPGGILNRQPAKFLQKYSSKCLNKGMLDTEDLIGALVFLLSENSKYINGQNIIVDDGFTL